MCVCSQLKMQELLGGTSACNHEKVINEFGKEGVNLLFVCLMLHSDTSVTDST